MKNQLYARYLTYFLIFQIIFIQVISHFPYTVEKIYSKGIYIAISAFYRNALGWIPFSVGDIIYILSFFLFLQFIYIIIRDRFSEIRMYIYSIFATISVIYFWFYMSWGINYYRVPLEDQLKLEKTTYTEKQLKKHTLKIIAEANTLQFRLTKDKNKPVAVPYTPKETYKMAKIGFRYLSEHDGFSRYRFTSIKSSILSLPLTYMGFAGYLNPFTGEAQVNSKIPKSTYPFTTCHEMAHQLGYAAENEANFIGYLACINHPDLYFKYTGELTALKYLLSEIHKIAPDEYQTYLNKLNKGIYENLIETSVFWEQYENPWEPYFKKSYNTYLKVNKQKGGIKSYSYMVNLLLNYPTH